MLIQVQQPPRGKQVDDLPHWCHGADKSGMSNALKKNNNMETLRQLSKIRFKKGRSNSVPIDKVICSV